MKCLYFTYDGLLDPLGQSQVLPYLFRLIAAGHSFTIISYEKVERSIASVQELESRLKTVGVQWRRLPFKRGRLEAIKRLFTGIASLRDVCRPGRFEMVHLRGLMPAVIYRLSLRRIPHLYDFRGFALEEWTDFGKIRAGSIPYRILKQIDRRSVETACGLVVLEKPAEVLLRKTYRVRNIPLKVIRTSTDVERYRPRPDSLANFADSILFVCLGGARRPYRPDMALKFVRQVLNCGIDCRLDFLNEHDHEEIKAAIKSEDFPEDRVRILGVDHPEVPAILREYDCGLVFCDSSPWRRVCSPTKLGEYLAAGLPVVSMDGIDVLDEFASSTDCVRIVTAAELTGKVDRDRLDRLISFIRQPGAASACRQLACQEFSLDRAGKLYASLYEEIAETL